MHMLFYLKMKITHGSLSNDSVITFTQYCDNVDERSSIVIKYCFALPIS